MQADRARPSNVSTAIHRAAPSSVAHEMRMLAHSQSGPARPACTPNNASTGTQVMADSSANSTSALPATYSARENGRERYSGRAPLTRSGDTSTGATQAVSMKASALWMPSVTRKNRPSMTSGRPSSPSSARAGGLLAT